MGLCVETPCSPAFPQHRDFNLIKDKPLFVDVTYSGGEQDYRDHIEIDVGGYGWALLYDSPVDDISSYIKKISEDLARIQSKMK